MFERLRKLYETHQLTIRFGIIGGVGFVTNYLTLKGLFVIFGLNRVIAELVAALVALQVTFILHDRWTYRIDQSTHKYNLPFSKRYKTYLVSNSFASLLVVVFFALFSMFLGHLAALALAAVVGLTWNYLMNKNVIWHHKPHNDNN
jgi:putative flippase GtrA